MLCYFSINVQDYFLVLHFFVAIDPYMGVSCVNRATYIILLFFCKIIMSVIYLSTFVSISNEIHTRKSGTAICLGSIKDGTKILVKTPHLISFIKSR